MSKCTRNKVSYNVDEALDCLLESDEKYLFSIATNISIPGIDQDAERAEFVVQEERPKRKRNIGPIMSLDSSLDETNYDVFDPPIHGEYLGKDSVKMAEGRVG